MGILRNLVGNLTFCHSLLKDMVLSRDSKKQILSYLWLLCSLYLLCAFLCQYQYGYRNYAYCRNPSPIL